MKKVITYGTFDMFHEGHYNILKRAREYGDYLIVGVTGEAYDIGRGKLSVKDSLATRMDSVRATGLVDEIIVEEYLGQKISDIIKYGVDVFVIGDDWKGKFDLISEYCELVYLPRTEGVSSTQIREETFAKHRIGIIADRCDDNTLSSECRRVSGFRVAGVYSETKGLAQEFCDKYDLPSVYEDLQSMFEENDIIYVRTDLRDRYRFIKEALLAGRHVIGDYPFTTDTAEAEELHDIAEEKNVILMQNLKAQHTQVFIQLLWMVKAGLIGDVIRVECSASKNDRNIRHLFYELTSSALTTVFNIMGTEHGEISKRLIREGDSIEFMSMTMSYPGSEILINIGNKIRVDNKIEIVGTKGTIRLGDNWWRADSFELLPVGEDAGKLYHVNYEGNGFKFIIKDMALMLNEGRREYRLMDRHLDIATTQILEGIR